MLGVALKPSRVYAWPQAPFAAKGVKWVDEGCREAVLPTGGYTVYTAAGDGSLTMSNSRGFVIASGATSGNDEDLRTSGFAFTRGARSAFVNDYNRVELNFVFGTPQFTNMEGFLGIITGVTDAITVLPTTATHMGIYWDDSADANYMLTSANGTDQVTTDTGTAFGNADRRLRITWTGAQTGLIEWYSTLTGALVASQSVAALQSDSISFKMHCFSRAEENVTKTVALRSWSIEFS